MSEEMRRAILNAGLAELDLKHPGARIVEKTRYKAGSVSEILTKKKPVSEEFLAAFITGFGLNREKLEHKASLTLASSLDKPLANARDLGVPIATHNSKSGNQFVELTGGMYLMYTRLVPIKAKASYLAGWGDQEYLDDLPLHAVVVKELHKGIYRSFEVADDSMDNNSNESIEHKSIVTGRSINRSLWKSRFHTKKFPDFIIHHRTEGVTVKRITEHNTVEGYLICHSLNPDKQKYPDFKLYLDDCAEIYNVVQVTKLIQ